MDLYKGFSIQIVRDDTNMYVVFPRIICFKRDEIFSILVDYKSNGHTAGIMDILSEKYSFTVTDTETDDVAAIFYENNGRYGECELIKTEVHDIPHKINTVMNVDSAPLADIDNKKCMECAKEYTEEYKVISTVGWKVCTDMADGGKRYEIQTGQLQEIVDHLTSDTEILSFNIEGVLFSRKNTEEQTETDQDTGIPDDEMDLDHYVHSSEYGFHKKYTLIADASSYPPLKIECKSILEAQIALVKHCEEKRDIRYCGNLFLGDEYVGLIDKKGNFHDKVLPQGKYNSINGMIHENCGSYPEYVEVDSVHYMRLNVLEYEIFCMQMDENNRYESDYPDKDAALYYSVEEQYIYPASNILRQKWKSLDKDVFDLFFIRKNPQVDFLFSEEILRIRQALEIQDICVLDDEHHVWILLDPLEGNRAFATMFHAFMCHKRIFDYDQYPLYQKRLYEADMMRIEKLKGDIHDMENTRQNDGSYHLHVSQMDAVLELIRKAEELGGKKSHDEIIVNELQEIITLRRYVEEIKINSVITTGDIYENGELL